MFTKDKLLINRLLSQFPNLLFLAYNLYNHSMYRFYTKNHSQQSIYSQMQFIAIQVDSPLYIVMTHHLFVQHPTHPTNKKRRNTNQAGDGYFQHWRFFFSVNCCISCPSLISNKPSLISIFMGLVQVNLNPQLKFSSLGRPK